MAKKVTAADFKAEVLDSPVPVMVDVMGPDCGQCRMMAPLVEQMDRGSAGKVKIVTLDTSTDLQTALSYGVKKLPTFLFFKGGELADTFVGPTTLTNLVNRLKALM